MKVLLVQPPAHNLLGLQAFIRPEPLGLEAVAGSLADKHDVEILDMRLERNLRRKLDAFKPDAVGVSASFTPDVYSACRVVNTVQDYNPHIRTFVGGHHATMCHSDFAGLVDAVVIGEGEITTPELLRAWEHNLSLQEVEGIAYQSPDGWVQTEPRPPIANLDETPLPSRNLTAKYADHYYHGKRRPCAYVETARGCPYRCIFCSVWRFYQGRYRARSPERVARELSQVEAPNVFFTDDNFLADVSRAGGVLQSLKDGLINKCYMMQVRADSIVKHRELLTKWAGNGLEAVFVGFESVTQKGLDALHKKLSVGQSEEAIRTLRELDIAVMSSFIVDPDFQKEDFATLRNFVKRMKLGLPTFAVLTPLPGTVLWEERRQKLTTSNYELFDLQHAVLPTTLGLRRFYSEYGKLYVSSYIGYIMPKGFVQRLGSGSVGSFFKQIWTSLRILRNIAPGALVKHHRRLPMRLPVKGLSSAAR